jgi:antitoxin VapB
MAETTVFQSGNSQAVRLPKEFRFKSKTVEIFRRGDEIVLREKPRTMGEVLDSLPPITPEDAEEIRRMFENVRDTRPPEERDWSWLGEAPAPRKRAAKPGRK